MGAGFQAVDLEDHNIRNWASVLLFMNSYPVQKQTRLPDTDSSTPGAYFVSACTINRNFIFETTDAILAMESAWCSVLDIFMNVELDEFVVMPNHVHGIIWITGEVSNLSRLAAWQNEIPARDDLSLFSSAPAKPETITSIISAFKTTAMVRINQLSRYGEIPIWGTGFYHRIVRDSRELRRIREYIRNNPRNWIEDRDNPASPNFGPLPNSIDDYWREIFDFRM
jgi:REP element-mobilizing transposase RayT